jgi:hypothetical protein
VHADLAAAVQQEDRIEVVIGEGRIWLCGHGDPHVME